MLEFVYPLFKDDLRDETHQLLAIYTTEEVGKQELEKLQRDAINNEWFALEKWCTNMYPHYPMKIPR